MTDMTFEFDETMRDPNQLRSVVEALRERVKSLQEQAEALRASSEVSFELMDLQNKIISIMTATVGIEMIERVSEAAAEWDGEGPAPGLPLDTGNLP